MGRLIRLGLLAIAMLGAVAGLAWGFDSRAHEGRVARGVSLAGIAVGGLRQDRLAAVVDGLADRYSATEVRVDAPGGGFTTGAEALGLRLSTGDTVRGVLEVHRTGGVVTRGRGWMASFLRPQPAPVEIAFDEAAVRRAVERQDSGPRTAPVEPGIAVEKGAFVAVPGKPGTGIAGDEVVDRLPGAARKGLPIVVRVGRGEIAPRWPLAEAKRAAADAQGRVAQPLPVLVGGTPAAVPTATLVRWIASQATDTGLRLVLDRPRALADLDKQLAGAGEPAVETTFKVTSGSVEIVPGRNGTGCCDPSAGEAVEAALLGVERTGSPVDLPLRPRRPKLTPDAAAELNIKTAVGSFETRHPGNQPRVSNIHRIADLVRGHVIAPGATFSVNDFVGKRTAENGFVSAPVIEDGMFSEGVGGGVSQFATTLFNAAFFAGLDFPEYQAHSIYISRYPRGREATLNYPKPDLKIRNSTPHGVLIWPTYTGTSIKVTLYSTKFVEGAQTAQSEAPRGNCTRVTTERTRTYLADGRTEVDHVGATYRPAEGVDC